MAKDKNVDKNLPAEPTYSERFTKMVVSEYSSSISNVKLNEFQHKLAQHLFVKVDMALKDFEAKRLSRSNANQKKPFSWNNINLPKLALDAVHRIELELDALIPNHIHPIPYFNSKLGVYDLDLRIGYAGKDLYYRKMSLHPIEDIIYGLVHDNDDFTVISRTTNNGIESYDHQIPEPFNRGEVVGGFGYIIYQNKSMNKLVLVSDEGFKKSESAAMSNEFWSKHPEAMKYKTIVHRTVSKIVLDPFKINASFARVENDEFLAIERQSRVEAAAEIEAFANTETIDIEKVDNGKMETAPSMEEQTKEAEYLPLDNDEPSPEEQEVIRQSEMEEASPDF